MIIKFLLHFLIPCSYCGYTGYAQIVDGDLQRVNQVPTEELPPKGSKPLNENLGAAVAKLTESVLALGDRLKSLEGNIQSRLQGFGESVEREKVTLENIASRLDLLDHLTLKVKDLGSRVEDETSMIRNVLTVTNKDVQRISTQLEELEENTGRNDIKGHIKKNVNDKDLPEDSNRSLINKGSSDKQNFNSSDEYDIGTVILEKIEKELPRLLAAELNHFYLNMATKMDYSLGQLQNEVITRLRRIETLSKKSLTEIQDGRQDMSHVTHLQRTLIDKLSSSENLDGKSKCEELKDNKQLKEIIHQIEENLVTKITAACKKDNTTQLHLEDRKHRDKGGAPNSPLSAELWRGVFSTGLTRQPVSLSASTSVSSKHCLDPSAFATLEEVKQLLRTLMSKGEDLRRTLTKQATEGVDLLKLLHQRFSVLLRRINTDPGHGEALLAEVQELEHLVENSYSSILLAQNVFIESCRRIQQEQPSIEGKIVEILNKLVTNIDLGHQFNRKQLQEVRQLIEQMNVDENSKNITLIQQWMTQNGTTYDTGNQNTVAALNENVYNRLVLSVSEANITEQKLQGVLDRVNDVEGKLQTLTWNSGNVKNIVDGLLTGVKDLKGYSRNQILLLQTFQEDVLKYVDNTQANNFRVSTATKNTKSDVKNQGKTFNEIYKNNLLKKQSENCFSTVLNALDTSLSTSYPNATVLQRDQVTEILQEIILNATSKDDENIDNDDPVYYDQDQSDMLMDDDHNWYKINYYDDDDIFSEEDEDPIREKFSDNPKAKRNLRNKLKSKNKITVLENDFNVN